MIHFHSCPICGSSKIMNWKEIVDLSVTGSKFDLFDCFDCTGRFTQNIPSNTEIGSYYRSEKYISHSDSKTGLINKLYHIVRSYTIKKKVELVKKYSSKNNGRLLDMGCGTGSFLYAMKKADWSVTGLEPDVQARQISISKGIDVYDVNLLDQLKPASFDVITLWHVIEHIHDLHSSLDLLRKCISENGSLIIAVPNYKSFDAKKYDVFWAAYDVPRHLYHFTPKSIELLMGKHQFELIDTKPMWFDAFYVSMLSEKYRKGSLLNAVINGFISNLITLFNKKRCSSLIYIFKPVTKAG